MSQQRVLLLGRPRLLAQSILSILAQESGIVASDLCQSAAEVASCIESFGPDVVVIAQESDADTALLAKVLRVRPDLPVVRVSLEENEVHIHRSERMRATRQALLDAIQDLCSAADRSAEDRSAEDRSAEDRATKDKETSHVGL